MSTFEALGIEEGLLQSIKVLGFTEPTPIQEKAIPVLLQGTKDFIGLAQTGTGKTAAFGLPLLQLIKKEDRFPQALIVCPTRELCLQIMEKALISLGEPCKSLLEAYYLQKQNMQVIAANFGYTNADNAKNQKYKCLMRLKKIFFTDYKNGNGDGGY